MNEQMNLSVHNRTGISLVGAWPYQNKFEKNAEYCIPHDGTLPMLYTSYGCLHQSHWVELKLVFNQNICDLYYSSVHLCVCMLVGVGMLPPFFWSQTAVEHKAMAAIGAFNRVKESTAHWCDILLEDGGFIQIYTQPDQIMGPIHPPHPVNDVSVSCSNHRENEQPDSLLLAQFRAAVYITGSAVVVTVVAAGKLIKRH